MAKDQTAILQQVVAELRQLNKSSKKDAIREQEALDRQEKLAAVTEETGSAAGEVLSDGQDFQRRFLAGQAKELLNKGKITPTTEDDKPATRLQAFELHETVKNIYGIFDKKAGNDAENAREKDAPGSGGSGSGGGGRGVTIPGSIKKAAGMAAMGVGIGGFISGLMMWSNIDAFKGDGFPDQMENLVDGWNHIGRMNTKAMVSMGALIAGGAFLGLAAIPAAAGMTAMGAGLGGFMSGVMMAGDLTGFKGKVFAENAADLTLGMNALEGISTGGMIALGVLAAGGAAIATKKGLKKTSVIVVGATAGAAALGGFMTGIAAVGDITKIDATVFAENAVSTVAGLKALETLDVKTLTVLGAIAAAGAVMSGKKGLKTAGKAALGASIMGAGIGGFMTGIGLAGDLTKVDGSGFAAQSKNVAEGIGAFTGAQQLALAGFITAGMVIGQNPAAAALAVVGMTAIGAGIGAFMTAMTGVADAGAFLGIDGTGLKTMLENTSAGVATFNVIDGDNLGSVGGGLIALAGGLTALFALSGATGITDTVGDAIDGVKNAFNIEMFSGVADKDTGKSGMDNLIEGIIGPMAKLAKLGEMSPELDLAKKGVDSVVGVLNSLSGLRLNRTDFQFGKIVDEFVQGAHGLDVAFNGGEYAKDGFNINVKNGIRDISALEYNTASNGIAALQHALNGYDGNPIKSNQFNQPPAVINNIGGSTTTIIQQPEVVRFKPGARAGFGARTQ